MTFLNEHGQPIGAPLDGWKPPTYPSPVPLAGRTVRLHVADPGLHAEPLGASFSDAPNTLWTYLPWHPPTAATEWETLLDELVARPDWTTHVIEAEATLVGMASYLRINPQAGSIEIGGILFSPSLQQTTAATETIFLLIDYAFSMGFRRVEWKCDDLNAPSRQAAQRFGFTYEGTFRQATHYKNRSRDTAWFAIVSEEWPPLQARFRSWLEPANFAADGTQIRPISEV